MTTVGMIGLGLVGSAIAERLLRAGFEVVGFDVAAERNTELHALGGQPMASAAEVIAACERTILSLPTSDIARNVPTFSPEALPGKTIVDTTTGEPQAMEDLGRELARHDAAYLVATIAGSSAQVRRGEALVMTGGAEELATECGELLQTFSRQRFHIGSWAAAARMKLVVNLVLGLNRAVLAEGLAFAQACDIEPQRALDVLRAGPAFSRVMETKGEKMVAGDFTPEARLAQHAKDVQLILEQGEQLGASLPLSALHVQLLGALIERGLGERDNSVILRAFDREDRR
jgi:3-hydroxyisobutyrate dehydrogenase-like beta-hydroxyacid dehydrogenase